MYEIFIRHRHSLVQTPFGKIFLAVLVTISVILRIYWYKANKHQRKIDDQSPKLQGVVIHLVQQEEKVRIPFVRYVKRTVIIEIPVVRVKQNGQVHTFTDEKNFKRFFPRARFWESRKERYYVGDPVEVVWDGVDIESCRLYYRSFESDRKK